jgi:hypothetical protein
MLRADTKACMSGLDLALDLLNGGVLLVKQLTHGLLFFIFIQVDLVVVYLLLFVQFFMLK